MLDDWEQRELAGIGEQLESDRRLARTLSGPSRRQRRHSRLLRVNVSRGYLLCSFMYMFAAMSRFRWPLLVLTSLLISVVLVVLEVRVQGWKHLFLAGLAGLGRGMSR